MNKHLRNCIKKYFIIICCTAASLLPTLTTKAQYFGQNKVRYKDLKFKVYKTPHFEIYYYLKKQQLKENSLIQYF